MTTTLLADAKLALRIVNADFDEEIKSLIFSCEKELEVIGISIAETDELYKRAVILYVKANFGYDDNDKFLLHYDKLKTFLSLSNGYRGT